VNSGYQNYLSLRTFSKSFSKNIIPMIRLQSIILNRLIQKNLSFRIGFPELISYLPHGLDELR